MTGSYTILNGYSVAVPVLARTLVDICPSLIGARLKIKFNKFNRSSINSIVQSRTVEAQTFNSHVIKTLLDSDWHRGSENYSNCVRVHVLKRMNRTNLQFFCSEDSVFV